MPRHPIALLALLVLTALPGSARALELGVQDDGRQSAQVIQDIDALHGHWTRTIAYVGQPDVAQRIRDAHTAGLKVILTVGGTGTRTRKPTAHNVLAYIQSLPRADRYTVINEPDVDGIKPCTYRRVWTRVRKVLGTRLLFGDFSPWQPLSYTAAVRKCGPVPRAEVALHPYQPTDPLAGGTNEGSIGSLAHVRRVLKGLGLKPTLWLDEFGYMTRGNRIWAGIPDTQAAWLWPRAIRQATRNHVRVLIAYTAQGTSWDTRPGPLAWCSMTLGRACTGAKAPEVHREPVQHAIRQADPVPLMLDYVAAVS